MRTKRTSAGAVRDDLLKLCTSLAHQRGCHVTSTRAVENTEVPLVSYNSGRYDNKGTRCIALLLTASLLCEGGSMVHRAQSRATHEDDCFLMKILDTSVKRNRLSPRWENGLLIHLTPPPRRSNPRSRATPARTRPSSRPRPGSSGSSPSSGCPSSSWWRT